MKSLPLITIALLAISLTLTFAQTVAPLKSPCAWTITYTYPEEANGGSVAGRIRTLLTVVVAGNAHAQIIRAEGTEEDMWRVGGTEYGKNSNANQWASLTAPDNTQCPYLQPDKYPGTDWINSTNYIGAVKYNDTDCIVFMLDPPPGLDISNPDALKQALDTAKNSAIVDATTHLPLELHMGGVKEVFTYQKPPTRLTLPPDLIALLEKGKQMTTNMSARAPRPF